MSISFSCQGCGAQYAVKDEFAGKKTRCKKCNAAIEIPQGTSNELDPPDIGFLDDSPASSGPPPIASSTSSSIYSTPADQPPKGKAMPLRSDDAPSMSVSSVRGTSVHSARPGTVAAAMAMNVPTRDKRKPNQAGLDGISGLLVLLWFLCMVVEVIMAGVNFPPESEFRGVNQEVANEVRAAIDVVGKPWKVLLLAPVALLVAMFAVVGPMMLLAWFVVSKIFRTDLPQGVYMRAIGVAVLPLAFISLINVLQIDSTWMLKITCILLSMPLAWLIIHFLHGEGMGEAAAVVGFGVLFYVPALIGSIALVAMIVVGPRSTYSKKLQEQVNAQMLAKMPQPSQAPRASSFTPSYQAPAAADPNARQKSVDLGNIQNLKGRISGLSKRSDSGSARENYTDELGSLRTDILASEPQFSQYSEYGTLRTELAALEQKIAALPSREPDAEIFKKPVAGESWDAGEAVVAYTPEMTILNRLFLRAPPTALIDLRTDFAQSAKWKSPDGAVTLTITLQDRTDPKQYLPWVVLPSMTLTAREKQLMFLVSDERKQSHGSIGSIVFTRGQRAPTETSPYASVRYVGLLDDKWLMADVSAKQKDDAWFAQFENAIRTLRVKRENEKAVDPLGPQFVVGRLADSPELASELLRKADAAAELPVLEVAIQPNHPARATAVAVLADIATEKSADLFWELSKHTDAAYYKPARVALRRIVPAKANSVTFAIEDIDLPTTPEVMAKKKEALVTLASTVADDRRDAVAAKLETILTSASPPELLPEAGTALAIWQRKETVDILLPFIQDGNGEQNPALDPIIRALGGANDKRVVMPILSWAGKRLPAVTDACASLGALAEDDLIKLLSLNPQAKMVGCEILAKTGTSRAVYMLDRISKDKNATADLQTKAREAVSAIKSREAGKPAKK